MRRPRALLLGLHRYVGLCLAAFLLLAGPTGSVAAFHDALDGWLNPDLFRARTHGGTLTLSALASRLGAQVPDQRLGYIVYRPAPGETVRAYLQPRPGSPAVVAGTSVRNEVFLDPATGDLQGARSSDGCCLGRRVLIPFLYRLHYSLGLGSTGMVVMGIVSILWSIDCVVGLLLTLPVRGAPWRGESWRRWSLAWRIEPGRRGIRRVFDLHRALSLWLWIVLLGIAISGVSLNLPNAVFRPVVAALLPVTPPSRPGPPDKPARRLDLDALDAIAARAAAQNGWHGRPGSMFLVGDRSATFYFTSSGGTQAAWLGGPTVSLDATSGRVLQVERPGRGRAGDTMLALQFPWHSGQILGLAGRIVVAVSGIVVPVLVVTGLMIWDRKRRPAPGARRARSRAARETIRIS